MLEEIKDISTNVQGILDKQKTISEKQDTTAQNLKDLSDQFDLWKKKNGRMAGGGASEHKSMLELAAEMVTDNHAVIKNLSPGQISMIQENKTMTLGGNLTGTA